jgi:hypothetical protein
LAAVTIVAPEPHFVCHKAIAGALATWMLETSNTVSYPNIRGSTSESTAVLIPYIKDGTDALRDYRYVPGLQSDDPENLILFYMSKPSPRTWHGDTHWFRLSRRWVVLNPSISTPFDVDARGWSECGEAISTSQLKHRLKATLEFLKSERRPGWQAIIDEQTKFLKAIQ